MTNNTTFNTVAKPLLQAAFLVAALVPPLAAHAHISLEQTQVPAGADARLVLRVGHGCQGSATHTLTVRIPPGLRGAKPMPKPGWTLAVRRAPLAEPYQSHGRKVVDDVVAITWKANSRDAWLADAHYDEFVLRAQAPATPGALWLQVQQQCEQGQTDWADVPDSGTSTRGMKTPAVLLDVVPLAPPSPPSPPALSPASPAPTGHQH